MKINFLFICLLLSFISYSQRMDKYQDESTIKKHKIKSRTIQFDGGTKSAVVCNFDKDGRLIQWVLTDNETGKIPQATITYNYNPMGKPLSAKETFGQDSVIIQYEYAANGKPVRKISKYSNGSLKEKTEYSYSPYTEATSLYWGNDEVYRKHTSEHDEKGNTIKFSGYDLSDTSAATRNWLYRIENEYDSDGKLLKSTRKSKEKLISIEEYAYNKRGLLISITTSHSIVGGFKSEEKFRYTFY